MKKICLLVLLFLIFSNSQAQKQFKALLFTRTVGFHHESINEGVNAIKDLANRHFFTVDWHEDPSKFNDENLKQYDVAIFLNTSGDIFDEDQQKAMEKFIKSGKGFVGIHSASDTEYDWDWYTKMVGRMFHIHPVIQTAKLKIENRNFPGLELMPDERWWTDEWYEFGEEKINDLNYLITVDETTFNPVVEWKDRQLKGEGMGDFHPLAWYHEYDGGRAFYTAMGHMSETYFDQIFLEHIFGGIYWAATGKGIDK